MDFGQRNPKWENIFLGDSPYTLGQSGCFVSVIGRILSISPDTVNKMLLDGGGFAQDKDGYHDLVDWNKLINIFPGITISYHDTYNNADVLQQLANGNGVIVVVDSKPIGGAGIHAVQYIGNHQLYDPWSDSIRPTSFYPTTYKYIVFSGKYTPSQAQPVIQNVAVASDVFTRLVTKSSNMDNLLTAFNMSPDIGAEANSYTRIIAYLQDFVNTEVAKRAPVNPSSSVPDVPSQPDTPPVQTKSLWKTDVLELLRGIFSNTKKG